MSKLINGRPMSELKLDCRPIAVIQRDRVYICYANPEFDINSCEEWAEILKPEPKPDANGWWKFADKMPEDGSIVQMAKRTSDYGSKHKVSTVIYRDIETYFSAFTHWKLWESPCE